MNLRTTQSTFQVVYASIAAITLLLGFGTLFITREIVAPALISSRLVAIESTIRSQAKGILENDTRSLRDELIESKAIPYDLAFKHFLPEEFSSALPTLLKNCRYLTPTICLSDSSATFLGGSDKGLSIFAVNLSGDFTKTPAVLRLWESLLFLLTTISMGYLVYTIRRKERILLSKMASSTRAVSEITKLFADGKFQPDSLDEYDLLSSSVAELGKRHENALSEIQQYKSNFERRTKLEQLGQTVGQISHDLKAPLNEAENFLRSLPLLMRGASEEKILEATSSLISRIQSGKTALDVALQKTKQSVVAQESLDLAEILSGIGDRLSERQSLKRLRFETSLTGKTFFKGDRQRFETAILNLVENSADEKADAVIRINAVHSGEKFVRITYQDNGPGIPDELLQTVFDPLVTYKTTGTGLGLSSTKSILGQHGATIRAVSAVGAKFEIDLPLGGGPDA